MSDIYKLTFGQLEQMFRKHNENILKNKERRIIELVPMHEAMQMVENDQWEKQSSDVLVLLDEQ